MSATGRMPDKAYDAFDYIMNNRETYDLLGQALVFFRRQLKRNRSTAQQEIRGYIGYGNTYSKRWGKLLREAISKAMNDNAKWFPNEGSSWISKYGGFIAGQENIMRLALQHSDQWSQEV
jgi:hypothetical protein